MHVVDVKYDMICNVITHMYHIYIYTLLYVASEALGWRIPLYHHQTVLQRPLVASRIPYYYMAFSSICGTLALSTCELL